MGRGGELFKIVPRHGRVGLSKRVTMVWGLCIQKHIKVKLDDSE